MAAYKILLDKGITRPGNYTFGTYTKTGNPPNSFYLVNFSFTSTYYIQAWAIHDDYRAGGSPNNYSQPYYYLSINGLPQTYTPVNAIDQLGFTPANVGGTNWNANAVATSLGYTPAKIGDSWISFRASYTSGAWFILAPYTFSSSPDLGNFTIELTAGQTGKESFYFYLRKNGAAIAPINYNISVNTRFYSRFVLVDTSNSAFVTIKNLNREIVFTTTGSVIWENSTSSISIDIIVYFSKNL